jgi:GNAT superfamily N-acetyltransferase
MLSPRAYGCGKRGATLIGDSATLVRLAAGQRDYEAISRLINEYVTWLRARYQQDDWFITEALDKQSLANEMEHLATCYGAPNGRAFVAVQGDEVRGCGAYRRLEDGCCEMKRLFVLNRFRRLGIGRRLCAALIESARGEGFRLMRLDTGRRMNEAISLYESLGFAECEPYCDYPDNLMPYIVFMELPL